MTVLILIFSVLWLAYSNGANDNFKGVATLYGSRAATYKKALVWATFSTAAGSFAGLFISQQIVDTFSGKGLVPGALLGTPQLLIPVAAASAVTIFLATRLGMPTSTTHALLGALLGVALAVNNQGIAWNVLLHKFALPLLVSPMLSMALTAVLYLFFRRTRLALGVTKETCVCVENAKLQPAYVSSYGALPFPSSAPALNIAVKDACTLRYQGRVVGMDANTAVTGLHYLSAASVCFSRAVNDTPKIAALLLIANFSRLSSVPMTLALVTFAVVAGGLLNARRVAETMSKRITELNIGQGLTANLMTGFLVLFASRFGLPVSTTHVSCGAIFGIGAAQRQFHWKTIGQIFTVWLTTLPFSALLSALLFSVTFQPAKAYAVDFSYENYAHVLKTYLNDDGMVNYKALKANREKLDAFCTSLEKLDPGIYENWTEKEKIAFWLNAYNAHILQTIINRYPIKASLLKSLAFPKNSIQQISGAFNKISFVIMGRKMTQDDIEHETLRKLFNEPRVHMALVCAAKGCPPLRNEPYLGEKAEAQLNDQTKKFLSNRSKFSIDRTNTTVSLSSIFKWFGEDFIKSYGTDKAFKGHNQKERAVLNFISVYLPERDRDYLKKRKYTVSYTPYDWSLNEYRERK